MWLDNVLLLIGIWVEYTLFSDGTGHMQLSGKNLPPPFLRGLVNFLHLKFRQKCLAPSQLREVLHTYALTDIEDHQEVFLKRWKNTLYSVITISLSLMLIHDEEEGIVSIQRLVTNQHIQAWVRDSIQHVTMNINYILIYLLHINITVTY